MLDGKKDVKESSVLGADDGVFYILIIGLFLGGTYI